MKRTRRSWFCLPAVAILGSLPAMAATRPPAPAADRAPRIAQIALERTCFGCAGAGRLVLRRDGSATLVEAGNARQGTADRTSAGRFAPAEFERLAALVVASGFFELDERYEDPDLQDGSSTTIEVRREDAGAKAVLRREDAGPPALAAIDSAIERLRARIRFQPAR